MFSAAIRLGKVLALRFVSGGLNLVTLLLLGHRLEVASFGFYSTGVASLAVLATISFGPLLFSIVSQHALMRERGEDKAYETTVVIAAVALALLIFAIGGTAVALGLVQWPEIFLLVSFGLFKIFQELQRTKILLGLYSACAIVQAFLFFILCYLYVDGSTDFRAVLEILTFSNFVGLLIAVLFSGITIAKPKFVLLRAVVVTGFPYTVSTIAENALFLGLRFIMILFGQESYLGVFSFCVDLAQRTVGFVINAASFVFVPAAFKDAAAGQDAKFSQLLKQAALLAGTVSLGVLGVVLALSLTEAFGRIAVVGFSATIFVLVSLAVIVNRMKKLLLDPLAMRYHSVPSMTLGYIGGAVVALVIAFLSLSFELNYAIEQANLAGYLTMATISYLHLRKRLPSAKGSAS